MKKYFTIVYFILLLLISISVDGQNKKTKNTVQAELESGTVENQFDYIITKSTKFREFQLIRKTSILKVKANALDSIKTLRKSLRNVNSSVSGLEATIKTLENEVAILKTEIETIMVEIDSISFFGTPLKKPLYNTVVWSIIVVLLVVLLFFIFQFKKGHISTKQAKEELIKTEAEFESFRKKALKKEQETMRKLQDEINKRGL
jgi:uncharacterized membrane protein